MAVIFSIGWVQLQEELVMNYELGGTTEVLVSSEAVTAAAHRLFYKMK